MRLMEFTLPTKSNSLQAKKASKINPKRYSKKECDSYSENVKKAKRRMVFLTARKQQNQLQQAMQKNAGWIANKASGRRLCSAETIFQKGARKAMAIDDFSKCRRCYTQMSTKIYLQKLNCFTA